MLDNLKKNERADTAKSLKRRWPVLYHGTATAAIPGMVREGIKPRGKDGATNYKRVPSNEQTVYMTDAYPHFFGLNASANCNAPEEGVAILEIDTTRLKEDRWVADEDFLEQYHRKLDPNNPKMRLPIEERTAIFRSIATEYVPATSLVGLGTIGYRGTVPWQAVKRVAFVTQEFATQCLLSFDPMIHIDNYMILGPRYRLFTRSFFDDISPTDPDVALFEKFLAVGMLCSVRTLQSRINAPAASVQVKSGAEVAQEHGEPAAQPVKIRR